MREQQSLPYEKINTIGIIYPVTDPDFYQYIRQFESSLSAEGKKCVVLGFVNSKQLPDFVKPRKDFLFVLKKDVTILGIPQSKDVNRFIHTSFDVLFDFNINTSFAMEYVCRLSAARLKAGGAEGYQAEVCGLQINLNDTANYNLLGEQVIHYLKQIS